ncbi:Choline/ethanolamine kinase [Gryllus bimaculatus]|nr:Choline/ethanolamine kinase [Gryllus bimaculatus]
MGIRVKNPGEGPEMRERAARLCRDYLHGAWKSITPKDIVLKRISGGLSNWLYHVSLPTSLSPKGSEPSQILLRLYGQIHGERALEGLITESVIFTLLSERHLGPKLHGIFPGGRIEEYIPARALHSSELSNSIISPLIAEKMAQVHLMNVPISKEPRWLWDTIDRWLKNVEANLDNVEDIKPSDLPFIQKIKSYNLKSEAQWLKKFLTKVQSPVVFCHNDLQEGNILLLNGDLLNEKSEDTRLVLIDFEYCSYNYRGFDMANHFIEWMYDYTNPEHPYFSVRHKHYPTKEQQSPISHCLCKQCCLKIEPFGWFTSFAKCLLFIRSYLRALRKEQERLHINSEEELALLHEVHAFTLASHFFWGLWSSVNARISSISFGYWEYAVERLESYFFWKNALKNNSPIVELPVKRKLDDMEG